MVALRLWLRRCTAAKAVPALIGVGIVLVASRHGWERDWRWAVDWAGIATYLLSPALAGLVAFDRSRLIEPTVADLGRSAPRATRGLVALALASWLWVLGAWAAAVLYVAVRVQMSDAVAQPDPWSLILPPALLLVSAAFGLVVGSLVPNLAAGPIAAFVCYLGSSSFWSATGLPELFYPPSSTGTRIGMERDPTASLTQISIQLTAVLACIFWVARSGALRDRHQRVASLVIVVSTVTALLGLGHVTDHDEWRDANRTRECLGEKVVVCGPAEADPLLRGALVSVETAIRRLGPSGLDWQTKYDATPEELDVPADSGRLSLQPENLTGDAMSIDDVAGTLMIPRMCQAAFGAESSRELMVSEGLVREWASAQLRKQGPVEPASPEIVKAYHQLRSCEPVIPGSRPQGIG